MPIIIDGVQSCRLCATLLRPCTWTSKGELRTRGWLTLGPIPSQTEADPKALNIDTPRFRGYIEADEEENSRL